MDDDQSLKDDRMAAYRDAYREGVSRTAARQFEDTHLDALRAPTRRRLFILVWGAVVVAIGGVVLLDETSLTLAAFVVGGGMTWLLRKVVRTVPDMPDYALDERLVGRRDNSYRWAYQTVVGLLLLVLAGMYAAADASRIAYDVQTAHLNAVFMVLLFGSLGLPSAIYGWLEPEV